MLDIEGIKALIPHRDPFLLIDGIEEYTPGESAKGWADVSVNAPYFRGHFPGHPVMPGVLIIEALAQVGAVVLLSAEGNTGKLALFAGVDKVRFKRQVRPGDTLRLEVRITRRKGPIGFGEAIASVDGALACSGELMFAVQ